MYTTADIRTRISPQRGGVTVLVMSLGNRSWRIVRDGTHWRFHNTLYPNVQIIKRLIIDTANLTIDPDDGAIASAGSDHIDRRRLSITDDRWLLLRPVANGCAR